MLLLSGPTEVRLAPRREAARIPIASGFELVETEDVTAAGARLARFRGDVALVAGLRRLLEDLNPGKTFQRLDDSAVFEAVARGLAAGDLVLLERRRSLIVWPSGEVLVQSPREVEEAEVTPPPPPAPVIPVEDDSPIEGCEVLPEIMQTLEQIDLTLADIGQASVSLEPAPSGVLAISAAMEQATSSATATLENL